MQLVPQQQKNIVTVKSCRVYLDCSTFLRKTWSTTTAKYSSDSYLILQLSCAWHGRYCSSSTPDVPKHSEHHDTEKQEVERCTDCRYDNEGVLRKLRKSTFFASLPKPPWKHIQWKHSWADTLGTYLRIFLRQHTRKKIRHFRGLVPIKEFQTVGLAKRQAPMNYIHLYKRIPPDCFLLWWPRLCGKDCEVDSLWNKKTLHISYANTKFFSWLQYLTGAHFCAWLTEMTPWVYLWALGGGRALKWRETPHRQNWREITGVSCQRKGGKMTLQAKTNMASCLLASRKRFHILLKKTR